MFAGDFVTPEFVHELGRIEPLKGMVSGLLHQLPTYISVAQDFTVDHGDVQAFTKSVLKWWANHGSVIPAWSEAAQIVFSFTPNSAAAERVFSMLKLFYGKERVASLADSINVSLMLNYNRRTVGHAK